mgnify:CR=1 FL=1
MLEPSASLWLHPNERRTLARQLQGAAIREVMRAPAGGDLQEKWWELALQTAPELDDASWILSVLRREIRIPGLPLDQELRWQLLEAWSRVPSHDAENFRAALEAEARRDPSETGQNWMTSIYAANASPEAKQAAFERALSSETTFSDLR